MNPTTARHKHFTGIMNYLVLSFYPSPNPFICLTVSFNLLAVEKKKTNKETKQTNKYKNEQTKKKKFQFVMHTFGSLSHTNHDHQDDDVNCYQSLHFEKTK